VNAHSGVTMYRCISLDAYGSACAVLNDQVASSRLLRLGLWAVSRGEKKGGLGFSAKMMTEDMEGIEGVAKSAGHLFGGRPSSR
jgi:hypothetical protein